MVMCVVFCSASLYPDNSADCRRQLERCPRQTGPQKVLSGWLCSVFFMQVPVGGRNF